MFLFVAPPKRSTELCIISAISLINKIVFSSKAKLISSNCLISQNPKIAVFFLPLNLGFKSCPLVKFFFIISPPASPKPIANKAEIFIIAALITDTS